ncbi:hypothetical protein UFOVP1040_84 [uncultured Caudovirales phage]|uniref:Uncharacterized protein n=1 Tax=uncultured Caudovirales phage TaxID=2100421 RepID=A0A6J5QE34_9CAUD|nr:hypothetical protein UFOVP1040_84 [uncultured Caudovirales phage]
MGELMRFSADLPFVVQRPFLFAGKQYNPGDPAPTDADERRLRQLYECRKITTQAGATVKSTVVKTNAKGAATSIEHVRESTAPSAPVEAKQDGPTAVHRGFGRWFVVYPDKTEKGPMKKAAAERMAAGK